MDNTGKVTTYKTQDWVHKTQHLVHKTQDCVHKTQDEDSKKKHNREN